MIFSKREVREDVVEISIDTVDELKDAFLLVQGGQDKDCTITINENASKELIEKIIVEFDNEVGKFNCDDNRFHYGLSSCRYELRFDVFCIETQTFIELHWEEE